MTGKLAPALVTISKAPLSLTVCWGSVHFLIVAQRLRPFKFSMRTCNFAPRDKLHSARSDSLEWDGARPLFLFAVADESGDEETSPVGFWVEEYFFRSASFDDDSVIHEYHRIGDLSSKLQLMRYHDHGHALLREIAHYLQYLSNEFWIKGRSRLVKEYEFRAHRQRTRDSDSLLLSAREFARERVSTIGKTDTRQHLHPNLIRLSLCDASRQTRRQRYVVEDGEVREQIKTLENHADVAALACRVAIL